MTRLRDRTRPITTVDPDATGTGDLNALADVVGDARVVCLGESDHGLSEITRLTDRITRFLVRHNGFTAFVLESGFAEGLAVDRWVRGGDGDLDTIARHGITYRFGERAETRAQLRWMHQHNTTGGHRLSFHGMDLPGSCAAPGPAVRTCLGRLPAQPGDTDLLAAADLGPPPVAARRWAQLSGPDRARLTAGFTDLVRRAADHGDDVALRCARSLCGLAELTSGVNRRDEFMADTVRWLLDREHRIVISSHNGHLQRSPRAGQATLGGLLAEELGGEVVVLATTYGSGPELRITPRSHLPYDWDVAVRQRHPDPTDVETVLHALGLPACLVDLRGAPADLLAPARGWRAQGGQVPLEDIPAAFDAIVHLRHAELADGVVEALREDVATARGDR